MANLFVEEYQALDKEGIPVGPPVATQRVVYTTSASSAEFHDNASHIVITADDVAHWRLHKATDSALATDPRLPIGQSRLIALKGPNFKIAAYDGSS